jgi:uncharacterized protein YjbJ (UPF0337 family)
MIQVVTSTADGMNMKPSGYLMPALNVVRWSCTNEPRLDQPKTGVPGNGSELIRPKRGKDMNWDQVEGKWIQVKGQVREKWGKLTDSDLEVIAGKRDQLVGRIQERYGIAKEVAEEQADSFAKQLNETRSTVGR